MTSVTQLPRASWLVDRDELPHEAEPVTNWSENYLTYFWSPATNAGAYFHLCRLPGELARWDEIMYVALPDGRWLVSRSTAPQRDVNGVEINGIRWTCDVPFERWTKRFQGGAHLVTLGELEAGALPDGEHVAVELAVTATGMSATYDWGTPRLDQSWAIGHYEQHIEVTGTLRYGDQILEIDGTGLRDHSWGPRDYTKLGSSTWIQGQFPESGRCFMVARVTGVPPKPELVHALTVDRNGRQEATVSELQIARRFEDADDGYEFELVGEDGTKSTVRAAILRSTRCSFHGAAQLVLGIDRRAPAHHHYVDAFTRFEWGGEVGYGVTEYTVDLL